MKDYVNEYLQSTIDAKDGYQGIRPRFKCADGTELSVQASRFHYCAPRIDGVHHYSSVEVGYPTSPPPNTWRQYADNGWPDGLEVVYDMIRHIQYAIKHRSKTMIKNTLRDLIWGVRCNTVYGYIPIELVNEYIDKHGGPR